MKLTEFEVKNLVYTWFKKLTDHAPVEEMMELIKFNGYLMRFPEAELRSLEDFKKWYTTVTNKFFDQVHELKMLDIVIKDKIAEIKLIVNWQARTWDPPEGYSKWEGVYAHQSWIVEKDDDSDAVRIKTYYVEKFDPMEGPLKI